jgi:hypothetical protein
MSSGDGRGPAVNEKDIAISCFAAGVLLQAVLLLGGRFHPWKFAGCIGLSLLIGAWPDKSEQVYALHQHSLIVIGCFALFFAMWFSEDVLSLVTERSVLFYSVLLWFAFLVYGYEATPRHHALMAIMAVPTIVTAYWTFREGENGFWTRLFLYVWFLCAILGIGLLQFPFAQLAMFYEGEPLPWTTPLDSLAAGMAFLFLAVNVAYLYLLIPIPGKTQSWKERMRDWHELTDLMTERLLAEDLNLRWTALFFAALIALLALDYRYRWIAPGLLINLLIVTPAVVLTRFRVAPRPAGGEAPGRVPHSRHTLKNDSSRAAKRSRAHD